MNVAHYCFLLLTPFSGRKIHEEKKKRFPGVQLNSLPTYRRALLSERLEQAKGLFCFLKSRICAYFTVDVNKITLLYFAGILFPFKNFKNFCFPLKNGWGRGCYKESSVRFTEVYVL